MFHGICESASGRITINDSGVLEQGHAICNMNYKSIDKNSWHNSSGKEVPNDAMARDQKMKQSP